MRSFFLIVFLLILSRAEIFASYCPNETLLEGQSSGVCAASPLMNLQGTPEKIYQRAFFFFDKERSDIIRFAASQGYEPARKSHLLGLLYGISGFDKNVKEFKTYLFQYAREGSVIAREISTEGRTYGIYGFERSVGTPKIVP